ncbi:hypothetical protein ESA_00740 [Cronobacter sakazakii ATCC BAA-894]|uniref:Uncharacterized protein n=1 Tax=Cronobacter sakazakii (strain ATCC BAA-894) TaxID=290339 RepID=A7MGW5_CROS8|nr:hypothetical protein ESA_00740 [Cronobacter sakazakii ATCC BAA-894]
MPFRLLASARADFAFAEEVGDFAVSRFNGIGTMGAVFGEAVCVVSAQGTCQRVCRVGRAQQVTVTLYRVFAFQYGNYDRARGHEFHQTVKERLAFVLGIKTARLLNGQVQHFGTDDFEACGFKTRENAADNVFSDCVRFDDGKSTLDCHDYLCKLFCLPDRQV